MTMKPSKEVLKKCEEFTTELLEITRKVEDSTAALSAAQETVTTAEARIREIESEDSLSPEDQVEAVTTAKHKVEAASIAARRAAAAKEAVEADASIRCRKICNEISDILLHQAEAERQRITSLIHEALGVAVGVGDNRQRLAEMINRVDSVRVPQSAGDRLSRQAPGQRIAGMVDSIRHGISIITD
jgi:hypothetical protein